MFNVLIQEHAWSIAELRIKKNLSDRKCDT